MCITDLVLFDEEIKGSLEFGIFQNIVQTLEITQNVIREGYYRTFFKGSAVTLLAQTFLSNIGWEVDWTQNLEPATYTNLICESWSSRNLPLAKNV